VFSMQSVMRLYNEDQLAWVALVAAITRQRLVNEGDFMCAVVFVIETEEVKLLL
jgi:hypothetical protein